EDGEKLSFDILDSNKIIPEELVPLIPVGRMVLNLNPDNFFAETEQVAFCTAHVVPGIDFSNDPLLAGRIHSYVDTQISRLGGPNFHEIPINAPVAAVHNNQRDGMHRQAINRGRVAYEPNSLAGGSPFQAGAQGFVSFPQQATEDAEDKLRGKPEKFADHYSQATLFFKSQTPVEQKHIIGGFRFELSKVQTPAIRERMVAGLRNIDEGLAAAVADGLGIALPEPLPRVLETPVVSEVESSPELSLTFRPGDGNIRTRKIAILVAHGVEGDSLNALHAGLVAQGAVPRFVGKRLGTVQSASGDPIEVDATLENSPSVLFDAVVLPDGDDAIGSLLADGHTLEFVKEQYRHCKTILALGASHALLVRADIPDVLPSGEADSGVLIHETVDPAATLAAFVAAVGMHKHTARDMDPPAV
ncbi:MAG: catalase, partial [Rhizobacter sp.]|nr:catalase [Rhizobacter sp.]